MNNDPQLFIPPVSSAASSWRIEPSALRMACHMGLTMPFCPAEIGCSTCGATEDVTDGLCDGCWGEGEGDDAKH